MTSQAKLAANRINAQKSTGPKTAEGKAKVSKNALKHGFTTNQAILDPIEAELFPQFAEEITKDFAPRNQIELALVDEIIACAWRLRRVLRLETDGLRGLVAINGKSLGEN